jgi:O-antigen ligase
VLSAVEGILAPDPSVPRLRRRTATQLYGAALVLLSILAVPLAARRLDRTTRPWFVAILSLVGFASPRFEDDGSDSWRARIVAPAMSLALARLIGRGHRPASRALDAGLIGLGVHALATLSKERTRAPWVSLWVAAAVDLASVVVLRFGARSLPVLAIATIMSVLAMRRELMAHVRSAVAIGDFDRSIIWRDTLELVARRPWLGVGPGNYPDYAVRYFHRYRDAPDPYRVMRAGFSSAHGNYPQVAAELGLAGLAALGWTLAECVGLGRRLARSTAPSADVDLAVGATGAIAGEAAASLLGDYLLPAYHNGGHRHLPVTVCTWLLMGALLAIESDSTGAPGEDGAEGKRVPRS